MRVALAQMDIKLADPDFNFRFVEKVIEKSAQEGSDVVVLPEMWNTGYALDHLNELADPLGQRTKTELGKLAKAYHLNIVGGSVALARDNNFYNEMMIFNRAGELIGSYDKVHRFGLMAEDRYIMAGSKENIFSVDGVLSTGVICYDIRFPEWLRKMAAKGAQIIFVSAEWPTARIKQWRLLLQARAIENQAFVVAVNRVGSDMDNEFGGDSLIVDPLGEIIAEAGEEEQLMICEFDESTVKQVRGQMPVFADRRTELYY
ncbi:carbon-nitrogen family hydrolase [Xylocopilactobacillus apicola]|uniref:Carbon-nitrogen hydrolase n=1 Tax=Xylocopilactobacillus apicola TaxID=2932184 RepID=A0AAU9DI39_9LACO|nr:carbon-nitrogen family hydrolase [Xylocopilactobacillus apicola]BDR58006.1 carbon-nitrogen hydrolase [Xylocopilactobacillus apicola]